MQEIEAGIFRSNPFELHAGGAKICSYILRRTDGNILVYGGGLFRDYKEEIRAIGGIRIQAISHRHETTRYPDWVRMEFGATRYCHKDELPAVPETFEIDVTFGKQLKIAPDFMAFHTPGHCPGSACFLWKRGAKTYAFTGDTLFMKDGAWGVDMANGDPRAAAGSLRSLVQHNFDVIVPGVYYDGLDALPVTPSQLATELNPLLERLENAE